MDRKIWEGFFGKANWPFNDRILDDTSCQIHGGHQYAETNRTENHRVLRCACGQVLIDLRSKEDSECVAS